MCRFNQIRIYNWPATMDLCRRMVKYSMKLNEFITDEELASLDEKASRKLCTSTTSNKDLGASNLASCKSQGLRSREGNKSAPLGGFPEQKKRGYSS